ncbi:heavy-metal-associated domain-containing protein [Flavobacterium silvaticum]|uniref:Cation transporter n=1 Tax=Flavobacterium silvaticum TaxID=1852020 RepID=A0A972FJW1_9FLAO|nr:heavy-metal-associated domain-containing protein [Flavobacterium silvaticum]NMH27032.1 cation transporter [Flavobacterium silvaticum]
MNLKKIIALVALPFAMMACKQTESAPAEKKKSMTMAAAKPETASFKIDGMVCAVGCAKTLEKKLAAMDGVSKVSIDFEKKEAVVEFDANKQTPEKLAAAVESTADGKTYKVHDMKASGNQAMVYSHEKEKEKEKDKKKDKKAKAPENTKKGKEGCSESKEGKSCCAKKAEKA